MDVKQYEYIPMLITVRNGDIHDHYDTYSEAKAMYDEWTQDYQYTDVEICYVIKSEHLNCNWLFD
jgi:hypothetical protein